MVSKNHWWEIPQIYNLLNLGTAGVKDELIRFRGQKVEDQGHDETRYGQKSLVRNATFQ